MNTLVIEKKKYVLVPVEEYHAMKKAAAAGAIVALPAADAQGNRPAVAYATASIARGIVRDREAVGLSQKELAERAGIRPEVLNRAERGVTVPSVRTLTKIENALIRAGLKRPVRT